MFKKVRLLSVQVQGFKGFKDTVTFEYNAEKNDFIGDNGKGKTSIGDIVVWILTGRNMHGNQKDLNVINKDCSEAIGILKFVDENEQIHEVQRKVGSSTSIKFDYETMPQKQLDELVPAELFLSVFNPIFFLSKDADGARKTITSLLPAVTKDGVLEEMSDFERETLEREEFTLHDTNEYLKNRRQELANIDKEKQWLEGYMAKAKEPIRIPESRTFDDAPLVAIQRQLEELAKRKPVLKDLQELLEKRNAIQTQILQIKHQTFDSQAVKAELTKEKALLEQQLKAESAKAYTPINHSEHQAKYMVMRGDYKRMLEVKLGLDEQVKQLETQHVHVKEGDQCPACRQMISKESVEILTQELKAKIEKEKVQLESSKNEKQMSLDELKEQGLKLVAEIERAKAEDVKQRQEFEEAKTKTVSTIEARLKEINEQLNGLGQKEKEFEAQKLTQIQKLEQDILALGVKQLEEDNARIQREFDLALKTEKEKLQTELNRLQKEKEEVLKHEVNRQALQKQADDKAKEYELRIKEMENYKKQEDEITLKISVMKAFNAKKIEILNRSISKHLTNVSIKLQRIVESTSEIKDCFEILYMGKELKICSTSETIRAGLELSRMISNLAGVQYPVFVDNAESITSYDTTGFQTIEVRVVKDKPLTMLKDEGEIEIVASKRNVTSSKPTANGRSYTSKTGTTTDSTEQAS